MARAAVSLAVLALYSVGFPVLIALQFFRPAAAGAAVGAAVDTRFLASRFREPCAWWEVAEMARRAAVTLVVVLLASHETTLALLAPTLVLSCAAVFQHGRRPYADEALNAWADRLNVACLCLSFVLDMWSAGVGAAGQTAALVVVVAVNAAALAGLARLVLPEQAGHVRRLAARVRGVELNEPLMAKEY